ncbi:MAG: HAMP domain-containing sensor histidine kinase, partial [Clostridia bacterium]|nr:HAMP domain-containing sensor histidine kinase [Clostridia bacterium]
GTYFSGEINFIVLDNLPVVDNENVSNYKTSQKINENEIIRFSNENDIELEKCYTYKTSNGYYVFVKYEDVFELYGESVPTIMYINIKPLLQYTKTIDFLLAIALLCVTIVMSLIGLNLGKRIEESQESQRRFFQNSSHELKTPLMAIQGYAEGIQTGIIDPVESSSVILEEGDRMTKLVDEILSISKIDAHKLSLNLSVTDIREILYDCLRFVDGIQKEKGVNISVDFSDTPIFVKCDEDQLERAFTNVLVNALRHCNGKITVSCFSCGKHCIIKIHDNGEGLSQEDIPHLFDRFYTGKNGSTGIGLALTAEILKLHKGNISAYNDEKGAVFQIKLPVSQK